MIPIEENKRPIKVDNYLISIKECKSGRFSEFKKIVLSELLYMYSNVNPTGELMTYENKTYHFAFIQKELAFELKKDTKDMCRAMKWLQNEGYITYFAPKATYVTINEDFITSKIKRAGTILIQNKEEINNKPITAIIEITKKEQFPSIESIEEIPTKNIQSVKPYERKSKTPFDKEQLINYLSNNTIVNFEEFKKTGYISQKFEYRDIINAIWHIKKAYHKKNTEKYNNYYKNIIKKVSTICKDDQERHFFMELIDTKISKYKLNS